MMVKGKEDAFQNLKRLMDRETGETVRTPRGTFLVVDLDEESFASLPPELAQKYMEHFKQPERADHRPAGGAEKSSPHRRDERGG